MPGRPHLTRDTFRDRRPLPLRVVGVALSCLCLAGLLSGCGSDAVAVPHFVVPAADRSACAGLVRSLPRHVSDQSRRPVTGSVYAAAWGDPAIVLRCGVGSPRGFDRFSACQTANGIDWFVPPSDYPAHADVLMTTVHRRPAVEVHLPATYRPPVTAMADLTRTIKAHTTAVGHCR